MERELNRKGRWDKRREGTHIKRGIHGEGTQAERGLITERGHTRSGDTNKGGTYMARRLHGQEIH